MNKKLENINKIISNIEFARIQVSEHFIVKFIAVSKYHNSDDISEVYNLGHRAFGENKVQNYIEKKEVLDELPIEWHFIGNLQKNKINKLIDNKPFLFHSLDSLKLAIALNERLEFKDTTMNALIQVNSAKEDSKAGFMANETLEMYEQIRQECPNIKLKGLMSIGAYNSDKKEIQKSFDITRSLFDELNDENAKICSMGMSGDYEIAIKSGANLLRIGSKVFV